MTTWIRRPAAASRAGLLAAVALLVTLAAPHGVRAAGEITFGTPQATQQYGKEIEFTVEATSSAPIARVELQLDFPDALGPFIVDVPVGTGTGTQALRYALDLTGGGHLAPNTPIGFTWAAFPAIGADPVRSSRGRIRYADTTQDWKTLKGDLITIHWYEGNQAFARKALDIGEAAVRDTAALLGVKESEPIDFFIYGDETSFRGALGPGTRENVGGQARADIRTLFALITPDAINDPWVGIVVPHELTHLVFNTAVENPYRFPPRWLNEGLAVYLSEGYGSSDRNRVADAVASGDLIPLEALSGQFPTEPEKTNLAYAEAVSAIDYLVSAHGRDAMISLVLGYRDGLTDDEAFSRAIDQDLATFEQGWLDKLGAPTPVRVGPRPAPAGPLPSGWTGPVPTTGTDPGASTARPEVTAAPDDAPVPGRAADGATMPLVVGGLALVIGVIVVGLILARRRGRAA